MLSLCWLASAQSVATPPTSDAIAWGDPVDGVQLHLALAKNLPAFVAPSRPGDLPHLQLEIRNIGARTAAFNCYIAQTSEIEIDGTWYEPGGFFETGTCANAPALPPGSQSGPVLLAFQFVVVNGKSVLFDGFHVGPGKHVVRVRTTSKSFGVEDSAHNLITLVSNFLTVEIPSPN
jgi:hypothetical protein